MKILPQVAGIALFGLAFAPIARAGSAAPAPPPVTEVPEEATGLFGGIGLEASVGYDSHYIFRGEPLQESTLWSELSFDLPLTQNLSLNLTPWFLQDVDDDYNEFDLTGALTLAVDPWEFSLGYAGYYYPRRSLGGGEGIRDEQELVASISRSLGSLSATVLGAYNLTREGFYFEAAAEYEFTLTDSLTLTPGVTFGWDTDYYGDGTSTNHVGVILTASYKVTPWCALSPYIAGNFATGHLGTEDTLFGGVKLTVTF